MSDKCKNCGESIIRTHDWGTPGWAHYRSSKTCRKAEPIEEVKADD